MRSARSFSCAYNLILTGFPFADATLRTWGSFWGHVATRKRLHGFMYALLTVTRTTLETIEGEEGEMIETEEGVIGCQAKLASTFRDHMTKASAKAHQLFYVFSSIRLYKPTFTFTFRTLSLNNDFSFYFSHFFILFDLLLVLYYYYYCHHAILCAW
jgi:hypothetical protein